MADEETQVEETEETTAKPEKGNRLVMVMAIVMAFLLLALGLAAGYIVGQANSPSMLATSAGQIGDDADALEDEAAEEAEETESEDLAEAIYTSLRPEFTVNFHDGQKERYLMASIDLMARDQEVIDQVDKDMPVVRYQILRVLGQQDRTLFEKGGKDRLLSELLTAVQGVVDTSAGTVEAIYFTSFVVQ